MVFRATPERLLGAEVFPREPSGPPPYDGALPATRPARRHAGGALEPGRAQSLAYSKVISTFKGKAARYFATAAQQRKFKHACDLLKAYGSVLILLANDHLYWSYRQLGYDPPNIDLSAQAIADADEDAATGHEGWDKWLAAPRSLP